MIAIDAMGGDNAPQVVVEGALNAAKQGIALTLFGDALVIKPLLDALDPLWSSLPITVDHCSQFIAMDEEPSFAVVRKKDASLVRAAHAVRQGRANALISAGNSGAVLAVSTLIIGRVSGVLRPAVGSFLPTQAGSFFCLDLGANVDCRPEFLEQFAYMGHCYVAQVKKISSPRIALLSNGHEPYKGPTLIKQVYAQLEKSQLNFIGNIEARDLVYDTVDVLVCDGFVGNVLLKTMQGMAKTMSLWIKKEAEQSLLQRIGLFIASNVFRRIKQKTDYARIGGALLLGVNNPVVLAHGSSDAYAIENAIKFTHQIVQEKRINSFNNTLVSYLNKISCRSLLMSPSSEMQQSV
jgi:phosphate acyltransferase